MGKRLPKMNPEIKKLWVAALRSGEYNQGAAQLCYNDGDGKRHCCLGVLARVADPKRRTKWTNRDVVLEGKLTDITGLPQDVQHKLISFNDIEKWSFNKIAAYVERYL